MIFSLDESLATILWISKESQRTHSLELLEFVPGRRLRKYSILALLLSSCQKLALKISWMDPFFAMNVTNNSLTQMLHLMCLLFSICICTDYGRRIPKESFFFKNPKLLCLGRRFGLKYFEAFGVFLAKLSAPILVLWVPCPSFPLFNNYIDKKSLYIQLQNIYLGVEFEVGTQRIWDLAFVCP